MQVEASFRVEPHMIRHVEGDVDDVRAAGLDGGVETPRRGGIGKDVPLPLRVAAVVAGANGAKHRDDSLRLPENVRVELQRIADVRHRADGQQRDLSRSFVQRLDDVLRRRLFPRQKLVEVSRPVELPLIRRLAELLVGRPVTKRDERRCPAHVDRDVIEARFPEHAERQRRAVRGASMSDRDADELDLRTPKKERQSVRVVDVRPDVAVEENLLAFAGGRGVGLSKRGREGDEEQAGPEEQVPSRPEAAAPLAAGWTNRAPAISISIDSLRHPSAPFLARHDSSRHETAAQSVVFPLMPDPRLRRVLRDPLFVFLIIGVAVFALDSLAGGVFDAESRTIVVPRAQVIRLADLWSAQIGRLPTAAELDSLVEDHIREEILVREAVRMGLDQDDTIVRRRLAQKMSFLMEDTVVTEPLTDADVAEYFEENAGRYGEPRRFTLRHVYVSPDRRGSDEEAMAAALEILDELRAEGDDASPENTLWRQLGDPFMLRREYGRRTADDLAELFGSAFVEALDELPLGEWAGPVESAYGQHLVRLSVRTEAEPAVFEEVRRRVLNDAQRDARDAANRAAHERLRERYRVEIEEIDFASELEGGPDPDTAGEEP